MSFKEEVITYLLAKGTATHEDDWTYGWHGHYSPRDEGHSVGCYWVPTDASEVVEYTFSEFVDTFSGSEHKVLLALTHVDCKCRKLKDVTIGIEDGAMAVLHDLLGIKKEWR